MATILEYLGIGFVAMGAIIIAKWTILATPARKLPGLAPVVATL